MYLFDSSAIIEMLKGTSAVVEHYKDHPLLSINLVYGEVYYYCLKAKLPSVTFKKVEFAILEYGLEDIREAMELLHQRKQSINDFSFVDALVYTVARKNNLTLVTKDLGFKGLQNVELIELPRS